MSTICIGLMSGTSLDGVDGIAARFPEGGGLQVLAFASAPFSAALHDELLALNTPGENELHRAALAANALMRVYAQVVEALMLQGSLSRSQVRCIGAHGQTVRHRPGQFDGTGYTLQLANPALLAELSGIDVVADFRSRDVAAGGQGAPLAPFFHRALFGREAGTLGVLNIGGISNLSVLPAQGQQLGFDCGPGNALMDHWCRAHTGRAFDADGAWAATGRVSTALLAALLADPYFAQQPPKSTGRDLFNVPWLQAVLSRQTEPAPADVQATLCELTATAIARDVQLHGQGLRRLVVCGGGALNGHLMRRLSALLPGITVQSSEHAGLPPMQVEAAAFAWLALQCVQRQPLSLESTTGARGARVLGAIYPA